MLPEQLSVQVLLWPDQFHKPAVFLLHSGAGRSGWEERIPKRMRTVIKITYANIPVIYSYSKCGKPQFLVKNPIPS